MLATCQAASQLLLPKKGLSSKSVRLRDSAAVCWGVDRSEGDPRLAAVVSRTGIPKPLNIEDNHNSLLKNRVSSTKPPPVPVPMVLAPGLGARGSFWRDQALETVYEASVDAVFEHP